MERYIMVSWPDSQDFQDEEGVYLGCDPFYEGPEFTVFVPEKLYCKKKGIDYGS